MHQAHDLDSFSIIQNIHSNTNIPDISQEIPWGYNLEIPVSVNNDITMSAIESDSYMTAHALFQFNEAAYGLTRLVVD